MITPRVRMVAGPNGSGKSTVFRELADKFPIGHWLNPDLLERDLAHRGFIDFTPWGLTVEAKRLSTFVHDHPLSPRLSKVKFSVNDNVLRITSGKEKPGYFIAVLSDFMRREWLNGSQSFTFETVMSGPDKVQFLKDALAEGCRTYLYFVCTNTPLINRERVAARVRMGGHDVPVDKINQRYARSLKLLRQAIQNSSRAYIFDNSGLNHRVVAEFENGNLIKVISHPPAWFAQSVLEE